MSDRIEINDIISPDVKKELKDIQKNLADLQKQLSNTAKSAMEMNDSFVRGGESQKETSGRITKINKDLDVLAKSEQEIIKIDKQYVDVLAKTRAERSQQSKQLEKLKILKQNQSRAIKEEIKLEGTQSQSIARLTSENKKLIAERNKLNTSTEEGKKRITDINTQLDKNNDVIKQNSSTLEKQKINVGNYKSALDGLPGPMGRVVQGAKNIGAQLLKLLMNPIVALIAAIVAGLIALVKAFKSSDEGATEFAARMEQMRAIIDVLRQRLIDLIKTFSVLFDKSLTWKERWQEINNVFEGTAEQMRDAAKAAYEYTYALDALGDDEISYISKKAQNEKKIAELEFQAQQRTLSTRTRRKALLQAIAISEEETKKAAEFAERKFQIELEYLSKKYNIDKQMILQFIEADDVQTQHLIKNNKQLYEFRNKLNDEGHKKFEELYAAKIDIEKKYFEENKRNISRISGFEEELRKEAQATLALKKKLLDASEKELEAIFKIDDQYLDSLEKRNEKEYEETKKQLARMEVERQRAMDKEREDYIALQNDKAAIRNQIDNQLFENSSILIEKQMASADAQKQHEIRLAGDNAGEKEKIEKKYDAERRKMQRRQAIIDKGQALFNTFMNTKEAMAKALTKDPTGILSSYVGILGGLQALAIVATPIPQFKKGTKFSPEGLAIVGEAGRELITYPSGQKVLSPGTAAMTYLPSGTKVDTAKETEKKLSLFNEEKLNELISEQKKTRFALVNQRHESTVITDSGMKRVVSDANNSTHYIDVYFRK